MTVDPPSRLGALAATLAAVSTAAFISLPARAAVTLDFSFSDIVCGTTSADGVTAYQDCATPTFAASVGRGGGSAFLYATLTYRYADDGLLLARPGGFQTTWAGGHVETAYEAAALYVSGSGCASRSCNPYTEGEGFRSIVLGLNDHPDELTGSLRLYTGIAGGPWSTTLSLTAFPMVLAAPVPEPSSAALLGAGLLLAGALTVRRRRDGGSAGSSDPRP